MSKDKIQFLSPLFLKYQADYEKNPRSRVFAPLAEAYRKYGMTDRAMEILSQGIRFNPSYVMGYLGLAFCYFDLKQFSLAYNTLRPLVETNRDNIRLQKLFADVCMEQGLKEEALDTYKYLLFINPRDKEVAQQVSLLESLIDEQYKPIHQPIYIPESEFKTEPFKENDQQLFDIDKLDNRPLSSKADFDDWMALDLSREQSNAHEEDPYEFWNLKKGDTPVDLSLKEEAKTTPSEIKREEKPDTRVEAKNEKYQVRLDFDDDDQEEEAENVEEVGNSSPKTPLVTHTLVDLYCGQGHIEKALEVLEKILILNPQDQKTINKISEIKALMGSFEEERPLGPIVKPTARPPLEVLKDVSEEDGRKNLMSIFDQQLGKAEIMPIKEVKKEKKPKEVASTKKAPQALASENQKNRLIEEKLNQFLKKIQKRALDYQARL